MVLLKEPSLKIPIMSVESEDQTRVVVIVTFITFNISDLAQKQVAHHRRTIKSTYTSK